MKKRHIKIFLLITTIFIILSIFFFISLKFIVDANKVVEIKKIEDTNVNSIWIGTFQLAWNELMDELGGKIEFNGYNSKKVEELNERLFSKEMISSKDYYIKVGKTSSSLRREIEENLINKFNIKENYSIDTVNWDNQEDSYTIFAYLNKKFEFNKPFDYLGKMYFNEDSTRLVKYFGINNASDEKINDNIKVLFYNENSYAIEIRTIEKESIILYYEDEIRTSFKNAYNIILKNTKEYKNSSEFLEDDELMIPYIDIDENINYSELCGHYINGTSYYLLNAFQNVQFELNNKGGNIESDASIVYSYNSGAENIRQFYFDRPFYLFIKEQDSPKPYFSIYVEDIKYLR